MLGRKPERKAVRSDKYQYILVEVLMSGDAWNLFQEYQEKALPLSDEKREILLNWDRELKDRLHIMIDQCLTPRQRQVLTMYADGYTQQEIAGLLDINQSSVTKSLNGNTDYSNGKKVYGGMRKKFTKIIRKNFAIRPIMKKIHLIWEPNSVRLPHYQTFRNLLGNEDEFERWLEELPKPPEEFKTKPVQPRGHHTKLTTEQILQIRQLRSQGVSYQKLTQQFHIGNARIKKLVELT